MFTLSSYKVQRNKYTFAFAFVQCKLTFVGIVITDKTRLKLRLFSVRFVRVNMHGLWYPSRIGSKLGSLSLYSIYFQTSDVMFLIRVNGKKPASLIMSPK